MATNRWMQKAVPESHRGLFTAKAKRAGYTNVQEFARHVLANPGKYDTRTRHQAQFAVTAKGIARARTRRRRLRRIVATAISTARAHRRKLTRRS